MTTTLPGWMDEFAQTPGGRHLTKNVLVSWPFARRGVEVR
jgi:hypothetical protein